MNQARGTKLGLRYLRAGAQPLSHFLSNAITLLRYKATVLLHSYFVLLPIAIRATLRIANTHSRGRPARRFSYRGSAFFLPDPPEHKLASLADPRGVLENS
jgi:hypothetical protein